MIYALTSETDTQNVIKDYALMLSSDVCFLKEYNQLKNMLKKEDVIIVDADDSKGMINARRIKDIESDANVIIVAKDSKGVAEANEILVSGYLIKPLTFEKLNRQFANLRNQ